MSKSNKILILDDEKIVTATLKTLLSLEGFQNAVYFNSPVEALEYLKLDKPDVIISDFMMPEMNGIDFLSEAKKMYPDISMILLTGYADKENAIRAINEVGLYKYIEKPWDNEDLILNIRNAIERSYLIFELKDKIIQLEQANIKLEQYSNSLEEIVAQRTADLTEANSKLNAIITNCADGIVIFSSNGAVIDVNPAAENMFGLAKNLIVQKNINDLFVQNCVDFKKIFASKEEQFIRDISLINFVNDNTIPVELSFAYITSDDNILNPNHYVAVIRNITTQKEMERLRDDFIATLTHDLRTPLLAAIQTLQFFLDGSLGALEDKQKLLLDTMKKSNQDMLGLVNALLEVYKYESGKLNLVKTSFMLNDLILQCCNEVECLAAARGSKLIPNIDSTSGVEITADKKELRRVIMNFIGNAINYTLQDGIIEVKAVLQSNDIIFSVKDNGIGISKSDIPKLFKRFSQGTSQKRSASTGLGLYLSKQIIEAHGGKVWLESDKAKGSEFSFLLIDAVIGENSNNTDKSYSHLS